MHLMQPPAHLRASICDQQNDCPKLQHKQRDENALEAAALNLSYLGLLIPRRLCGDLSNRRGIICRRSAGRLILITLGRIGIIGNTDAGRICHNGPILFAI